MNTNDSEERIVAFISTREELDEWKRKIGLRLRNDTTDEKSINLDNNHYDVYNCHANICEQTPYPLDVNTSIIWLNYF